MQKQREKIIAVSCFIPLCFQNDSGGPIIWGKILILKEKPWYKASELRNTCLLKKALNYLREKFTFLRYVLLRYVLNFI